MSWDHSINQARDVMRATGHCVQRRAFVCTTADEIASAFLQGAYIPPEQWKAAVEANEELAVLDEEYRRRNVDYRGTIPLRYQ